MFNLHEVIVRPVFSTEEQRFQELMHAHHHLKSLPKISETIWYVATFRDRWVAIFSFSAAALKCSSRDRWIGWSFRHQYDRLKWLTNNSRFLILPDWHLPNLASRILSLSEKTISASKPEAASGVGIVTNATTSRASMSSATFLSASGPNALIVHCNAGTSTMANRTKAWPLTAKPCATPSMKTVIKSIS